MEEDGSEEYNYAVVQFLEQPYDDIDDYVCVPYSWIQTRRLTDRRIMVAYPKDESPSLTRLRMMRCEEPSELWQHYMAVLKMGTNSRADACEFIMDKIHNAPTRRHSAVMSIDHEVAPAPPKVPRRYSPAPKTSEQDPQSKSNNRKQEALDNATLVDTISTSSKLPEHNNVVSKTSTTSDPRSHVSPQNIVTKKIDDKEKRREYQEENPHDVLPSLRYPHLEQIPNNNNGIQVNTPTADSQSMTNTIHASRSALNFVYEICGISDQQKINEELSICRENLHQIALTYGIQNKAIPYLRTFDFDIPEPLSWNKDFEPNASFVIQKNINEDNQIKQLEVPKSVPVNQDHPQVLPIAIKSSEVACAVPKPSYQSTCYDPPEYQDSTMEQVVSDGFPKASCIGQNVFSALGTNNESSADPNALNDANHSDQPVESSMEKEAPIIDLVTSSDASSDDDGDYDDDDGDDDDDNDYDDGDVEASNSPEITPEEVLTASSNPNKQENQSVDSKLKIDVWVDRLVDIFQQMKVDFSDTCEISYELYQSLSQTNKVIEGMADAVEMFRKKTKTQTIDKQTLVSVDVQQMPENNPAERKEEENHDVNMEEDSDVDSVRSDDDDDDDVDDVDDGDNGDNDDDDFIVDGDNDGNNEDDRDRPNEVPKTTRGNISSFVLPPEYDPDDTRWTLKYRKKDPKLNLVELIPKRNVFIDSIKLAHCKRTSKDYKTLARKLLEEIFTQSALSVCSLTGSRPNAFHISGNNVRPGLDESARMAILIFVEKYGRQKKWGVFDSQSITNTLRSKIQHIRKICNN